MLRRHHSPHIHECVLACRARDPFARSCRGALRRWRTAFSSIHPFAGGVAGSRSAWRQRCRSRTSAPPRHFAERRGGSGCGAARSDAGSGSTGLGVSVESIGRPHPMHAEAASEIRFPQSGHVTSGTGGHARAPAVPWQRPTACPILDSDWAHSPRGGSPRQNRGNSSTLGIPLGTRS